MRIVELSGRLEEWHTNISYIVGLSEKSFGESLWPGQSTLSIPMCKVKIYVRSRGSESSKQVVG